MSKLTVGDWFERMAHGARELGAHPNYTRADGTTLRSPQDAKREIERFQEAELLDNGPLMARTLVRAIASLVATGHLLGMDLSTEFQEFVEQLHEEFPGAPRVLGYGPEGTS